MTSPSAPSAFPKFTQDVCQLDRALLASASRAHIVIEEALDEIALFIEFRVICALELSVAFGRDNDLAAMFRSLLV
jgi:hypothetical protein